MRGLLVTAAGVLGAMVFASALSIWLTGCAHPRPVVLAPPPPCMPDEAKLELARACAETDWPIRSFAECPSFGDWLGDYVRWRDGSYGADLCETLIGPDL